MVSGGVAIRAIGIDAGEATPVAEAADGDGSRLIDFLKSDGFVSFRRSRVSVAEMAGRAVQHCLARSDVPAREIDTVLFSTESFWDGGEGPTDPIAVRNAVLSVLFGDCGLSEAHIQACWTNECANLSATLSLARALVMSESSRNVLVVVGDRQDTHVPRLMPNGASVMSDVAAAALVTQDPEGPALRHVVTHNAPDVFAAERSNDVQRKTQAMMSALQRFASRVEVVTGRAVTDYSLVLTDNLHSMYLDFICEGLGLDPVRTRQPSKADFAHGFSLDGLLGLEAIGRDDLPKDEPIAILNVIPWSFGFSVLEAS
jgi:hypothetical protein